jgi:hypothetical protein
MDDLFSMATTPKAIVFQTFIKPKTMPVPYPCSRSLLPCIPGSVRGRGSCCPSPTNSAKEARSPIRGGGRGRRGGSIQTGEQKRASNQSESAGRRSLPPSRVPRRTRTSTVSSSARVPSRPPASACGLPLLAPAGPSLPLHPQIGTSIPRVSSSPSRVHHVRRPSRPSPVASSCTIIRACETGRSGRIG